ncbi:MAG TPA: S4 domain-containing protein, partial [Pirellulales bacterium]|nr:S4 domain-containing protein [Pirellulales bacterium]
MPRARSQIFHVAPEESQQTLAALLRQKLEGAAWSETRKLIRGRHVQINGNLCMDAGRRLKPGE